MSLGGNTSEISSSLDKIAKTAGWLFLFFTIGSILHYSIIDLKLISSDDLSVTAHFIRANELLFRIGIAFDILLFLSILVLSQLLYTLLRPINEQLALLAMTLIVIETAVAIFLEFSSFMALSLVNAKEYWSVIEAAQSLALLGIVLDVKVAANTIVILLFDLALIIFFYLFFKSKYIPQKLAITGIISFLLMLLAIIIKIIFPDSTAFIGLVGSVAVMLFQILIGIWLSFKGIQVKNLPNSSS